MTIYVTEHQDQHIRVIYYKPLYEGNLGETLNPHAKISDHSPIHFLCSLSLSLSLSFLFSLPSFFSPRAP
ncbi:hypothetical protein VNO78_12077 [Psophocarpus tetragonolobus]|uniref:Uncharacterized protein n=1 Tax=Psophocarpus tetragonolobus TaxID=3891 RepID=A0AAN9SNB4_PSOTE